MQQQKLTGMFSDMWKPIETWAADIEDDNSEDPGEALLNDVLSDALAQCIHGKGKQRHGNDSDLLFDQPWLAIAKTAGPGFLTGQAIKKLMEASSLNATGAITTEAYERELLGAIVYTALAVLYRRTGGGAC